MRMMIGFHAEIPDRLAEVMLQTAGVEIPVADIPLALALVVVKPFAGQMRDFLLSPEHVPVPLNQLTRVSSEASEITVELMLQTEDKDHPIWTGTKKMQRVSQKKPSKRRPAPDGASASKSASKSARRSGKRTSTR